MGTNQSQQPTLAVTLLNQIWLVAHVLSSTILDFRVGTSLFLSDIADILMPVEDSNRRWRMSDDEEKLNQTK